VSGKKHDDKTVTLLSGANVPVHLPRRKAYEKSLSQDEGKELRIRATNISFPRTIKN